MTNQYGLNAVSIPPELQEAMGIAYDAMAAKRDHILRLRAGKKDIEQDIAAARLELDAVKKSHVDGFAKIASGATTIPKEAKAAKAKIAEITARIMGLEETLPDFEAAITAAKKEMPDLRRDIARARRKIVVLFLKRIPKMETASSNLTGLLNVIDSAEGFNLESAMMLYLAANEAVEAAGGNGPFPQQGRTSEQFFAFVSKFFARPSEEEIAVFQDRYEAMIWGDRKPPERIPMPKEATPDDDLGIGVNWPEPSVSAVLPSG